MPKVSSGGSTEVGEMLVSQASEQVLRTSMEVGGNAPFVVFEDARSRDSWRRVGARSGRQSGTAPDRQLLLRT